jgi:TM2 domain-containing membrane protein YozV
MANAILAAILSLILPGLGQLYGGQGFTKGIIFIIVALIFYAIGATTYSFVWLLSVIFSIYAAYDAYTKAA